ncbi:GH92 family glycosyl hydrolase [Spirosoma oryzicola]|uniref:GH92 family glycosyl hydrolase n=1 Tax=Spirosoma oryzicola TaxID=2898794 RepID=UPI001E49A023|nr:GH92 family glycosyl hydrolase [Spirosoma oryzicola]UHG94266.1 GH92 family glycosyl hydrolase [Spirosoma oryzicola]
MHIFPYPSTIPSLLHYRLTRIVSVFCLLAISFTTGRGQSTPAPALPNLTQYVDPFIGTDLHGHVFMGANVPFGAVQLGPTQLSQGWDWSSGYHYSDSLIVGFSHMHLSETGIGDLGDILFMPTTGPVKLTKGTTQDSRSGYTSRFTHASEKARPGYYAVQLQRYNIGVELTTTERVGFHRYTFPSSQEAHVLIDLQQGIGWDRTEDTYLRRINDSTLVGYRYSAGWAEHQRVYFTAVFSRPIRQFSLYDDQTPMGSDSAKGSAIKGVISFAATEGDQLSVKVGISPVSIANASANIQAELPHWNFNRVVAQADTAWNRQLNKIAVRTSDLDRLKVFYTALYHSLIEPFAFNDHNGDYRGTDGRVYRGASFTNLTTFSLWDTYRATHPLFTIWQPDRVADMINSMLAIHQQQGKLPIWPLVGNETYTMVGNSAIPVVADACLKGFSGFDHNLAYEAMKSTAMLDERSLDYVKTKNYIPADATAESVSKGLEYAINDWCVAQVACKLGRTDDYTYFLKRSKNYVNYFNAQTRFMRGRLADGSWRTPFSQFESLHQQGDFTEGNAWQYTWLVPHDVEGLIGLLGGDEAFNRKLDSLFVAKGNLGDQASADITGLIGQYAHGNEPSHHIAYLYAYSGQPGKTATKVRYILDSLYSSRPDGLCGNEDAGQMSAWYIFSALGFYPVNPANGAYVFGSPVFDEAVLDVGSGRTFTVRVRNNSRTNIHIQRMWLNGRPYSKAYLLHQTIMRGGELTIEMGPTASAQWGVGAWDRPSSESPVCCQNRCTDLSLQLKTDRRIVNLDQSVSVSVQLRNTTTDRATRAVWECRLPDHVQVVNSRGLTLYNGMISGSVTQLSSQSDTTFYFDVRPLQKGTYRLAAQLIETSAPDPDSQPDSGTEDGQDDAATIDFRTQAAGDAVFISPNPIQTSLPDPLSNQPAAVPDKADLSLRMSASTLTPRLNEVVSYTITVTNSGGRPAQAVRIANPLPDKTTLVGETGWSAENGVLSQTIPSLPVGASAQLILQLQMNQQGPLINRAQISASSVSDPDSTPNNGFENGEDDQVWLKVRVR